MSNMPVFYVDELMHMLSSDEFKLLGFLTHKIVGENIPFEGDLYYKASPVELCKGSGLESPAMISALSNLILYGVIGWVLRPNVGPALMLLPLDEIDLKGLSSRGNAS